MTSTVLTPTRCHGLQATSALRYSRAAAFKEREKFIWYPAMSSNEPSNRQSVITGLRQNPLSRSLSKSIQCSYLLCFQLGYAVLFWYNWCYSRINTNLLKSSHRQRPLQFILVVVINLTLSTDYQRTVIGPFIWWKEREGSNGLNLDVARL